MNGTRLKPPNRIDIPIFSPRGVNTFNYVRSTTPTTVEQGTGSFSDRALRTKAGATNIAYYWPSRVFPANSAVVLPFYFASSGRLTVGPSAYSVVSADVTVTFLKGLWPKEKLSYDNQPGAALLGDSRTFSISDTVQLSAVFFRGWTVSWSSLFNPTHDYYGWKVEITALNYAAATAETTSNAGCHVPDYVSVE